MNHEDVLLTVKDLHTHFFTRQGVVKAVNGVSFTLRPHSILGIVGESGSGKTVTALSLLRLVPYPGKIVRGEVVFAGQDLLTLDKEALRRIRGKEIALIFQDAASSLNPIMSIGPQIEEMIAAHLSLSKKETKKWVIAVLRQMGIPAPERAATQYPFQLSGGMNQRVMIAIATLLNPKIIIADEPTSALDATLQAQILYHLRELKEAGQSSIILITHDLGIIAQMADEVGVMYAGTLIESATASQLLKTPTHPYTWALLRSLPRLDSDESLRPIRGSPPNPLEISEKCAFIPRCHKARNECRLNPRPPLQEIAPHHWVACYNPVRYDWD
ncbi:MAG: ABC transporter ATP-binding protein [Chloroflexi bacterium]|nr:ABC transporter ATP-binding protein [Chloroflexota bacterium]